MHVSRHILLEGHSLGMGWPNRRSEPTLYYFHECRFCLYPSALQPLQSTTYRSTTRDTARARNSFPSLDPAHGLVHMDRSSSPPLRALPTPSLPLHSPSPTQPT